MIMIILIFQAFKNHMFSNMHIENLSEIQMVEQEVEMKPKEGEG